MELDQLREHAKDCLSNGKTADAVTALETICQAKPQLAEPRFQLAQILERTGDPGRSIFHLQELLKHHEKHIDALVMLARLQISNGQLHDALTLGRFALENDPGNVAVLLVTGIAAAETGQLDDAETMLEQAVENLPADAHAHVHLARVYMRVQKYHAAEITFMRAQRNDPALTPAGVGYGNALLRQGRYDEAKRVFTDLCRDNAGNASLMNQIGNMCRAATQLDSALEYYRLALDSLPGSAEIRNNIGNILLSQGKHAEAREFYLEAVHIKPDFWQAHSNLVLLMSYLPDTGGEDLLIAHKQWATRQTAGIPRCSTWGNSRLTDRPLRVAYLSPDFHHHPVSYFIKPILLNHNRERVVSVCLSDSLKSDTITGELNALSTEWYAVNSLSDEQVAELIRRINIDILVDLAGHTSQHRLGVFARKPAPVQISYLGYPATTGLDEIDYRLTDTRADIPSITDKYHTEQLIYMPSGFLCYQPDKQSPEPGPLPYDENGYITFGSLNNLSKVNEAVISTWSDILHAVPGSRIMLKNLALSDPGTRESVLYLFDKYMVNRNRIVLLTHAASYTKHLETYKRIDIALDTFPYNGTTTTCEALWMGVPVISLTGKLHAGRVGYSLLSRTGLIDFIAHGKKDYVQIATDIAGDPAPLRRLRQGLRESVRRSPLCDSKTFTHELEDIYEDLWEAWSHQSTTKS